MQTRAKRKRPGNLPGRFFCCSYPKLAIYPNGQDSAKKSAGFEWNKSRFGVASGLPVIRSRQGIMLGMQFKCFRWLIFPWLIFFGSWSVGAQVRPEKCDLIPHVNVPVEDLPTAGDKSASCDALGHYNRDDPSCDALSLYYSDLPRHVERARYLVFSELGLFGKNNAPADPLAAQTTVGADALVLAMIYASGEGVTRNLPLARQFVCQDSDDTATPSTDEMLHEFDDQVKKNGRFDACEDGGAGFGRSFNYQCLGLQEQRALEEIHQREESILTSSSPPLKTSFMGLRAAYKEFQNAYSDMRSTGCEGGTGCGPISEGYDRAVERTWLAALTAIQAGSPPCSTANAAQFAQLDSELNRQYREGLKGTYMDVNAGDQLKPIAPFVRAADRAWLKYRDAWVAFGQLRWSGVPADQWRAWQTKVWIDLLTLEE
jgi:hypothetical protein